jgi:hypothetical protein
MKTFSDRAMALREPRDVTYLGDESAEPHVCANRWVHDGIEMLIDHQWI